LKFCQILPAEFERVAVDTKRRETDIVQPFLYGSVEPLYSLLRNLRGKNG
jgi:hypothetical protein